MTLGQEIQLGLGILAVYRKHADIAPVLKPVLADALNLFAEVFGPLPQPQPVHEIVAQNLTPDEKSQFDRASNPGGAG